MKYKILSSWWLALSTLTMTAKAAGRTRFRAIDMFEQTTEINCSTAMSTTLQVTNATCVGNCQQSIHCAKTGFDIEAWRKCLIDLTPYCQFYPKVFFGGPISAKSSYTEVDDDTVNFSVPTKGVNAWKPGRLMFRWAIPPELVETCTHTYTISCGAADSLNVLAEVVRDWRKRPYLTVKTDTHDLNLGSCSVADEDNTSGTKSRCLYDEAGRFYASGSWSIELATPRAIAGSRKSATFHAPLNVRDEWYIGAVPAAFYDS